MPFQHEVKGQLTWSYIKMLHILAQNNVPQFHNVIIPASCQQVPVVKGTIHIWKQRNKLRF
jgi:hypothetical protein